MIASFASDSSIDGYWRHVVTGNPCPPALSGSYTSKFACIKTSAYEVQRNFAIFLKQSPRWRNKTSISKIPFYNPQNSNSSQLFESFEFTSYRPSDYSSNVNDVCCLGFKHMSQEGVRISHLTYFAQKRFLLVNSVGGRTSCRTQKEASVSFAFNS